MEAAEASAGVDPYQSQIDSWIWPSAGKDGVSYASHIAM